VADQEEFANVITDRIKKLEQQHDYNMNKTTELQNWIDVYMPMRF